LRRLNESRQRAKQFLNIANPDPEAQQFADKHAHKEVVVGKVIEIQSHPSLDSMLSEIKDLGIPPGTVTFSSPSPKDFGDVLKRCGGLKAFPPPNLDKYGIARLPLGTMDDQNHKVDF